MSKVYYIIIFLLGTLFGCQPVTNDVSEVDTFRCVNANPCRINTDVGTFIITFDTPMVITEESFSIKLSYQASPIILEKELKISAIDAFLEGKHMYMGKIPAFFHLTEQDQSFIAALLLGRCSASSMVWRLWISVSLMNKITNKPLVESFHIDFTSHNK